MHNIKQLIALKNKIDLKIVNEFAIKHDYELMSDEEPYLLSDYYVDMQTILWDLVTNQPVNRFIQWYDHCLDCYEKKVVCANYENWCRMVDSKF